MEYGLIQNSTERRTAQVDTLSVVEAGRRLGIGRSLAYRLVRLGRLPALHLGRKLRVPVAGLEAMLATASACSGGSPADEVVCCE
jgi:excisionase family DNA binding protein